MTIKNKIATSLVASTLLVTAAFAAQGNGTLAYSSGKASALIAEELYQLDGDYNASIGSATNYMEYTADLDGSGTVSDAAVNLTFTGAIAKSTATDQFVIFDTTDGNKTIAVEIAYNTTTNTVTFDSDSQYTFANGKKYGVAVVDNTIALGDAVTAAVIQNDTLTNGTKAEHDLFKAKLELYSTSGTEVLRDVANIDMFSVVPQYHVSCDNKFNNLINVENSSYTFVSTKHGKEDTNTSSTSAFGNDIMETLSDVMRFTVTKTAVDFGLDGNASVLSINADNNTTILNTINSVTSNFADGASANNAATNGHALQNGTYDINVTDSGTTATNGFYGLDASTNTYTVNITATGTDTIPATHFTANFYINDTGLNGGDSNTTYTPADAKYTPDTKIGQWSDFAYIAQIAGATEDASTKTKLFIVNRSCKSVAPILTLIKDGVVTTVTLADIAVNNQGKYVLGDILTANGLPQGRYAVEITIPGNAEDFYVYAQAQSRTDVAATKDLPVYNTSTRD